MKLLISIFLMPFFVFADLSDGDSFIVNQNRVESANTEVPGFQAQESFGRSGLGTTSGGSNRSRTDDRQESLSKNQGFQLSEQGEGGLQGSSKGEGMAKATQMMGLAMGGMFASQCGPQNPMPCALAVMSLVDAAAGMLAKDSAGTTSARLDPNSFGDFGSAGFDPLAQQAFESLKDLEAQGFYANADGSVTLPDGSVVSAQDFANEESIKNLGINGSQAKKLLSDIGSVKSSAAKKAGIDPGTLEDGFSEFDETGGVANNASGVGSYESGAGGFEPLDAQQEIYIGKKKKKKSSRMPASQAAALSKDFNGTPIGINMANLFLIVHDCYAGKNCPKLSVFEKEY